MNVRSDYQILETCNVCGCNDFFSLFSSKNMPLTGLYVPADIQNDLKTYDQEFLVCNSCGHGQLKKIINPEILYDDTYTHRSSESPISISGNDFFYKYITDLTTNINFSSILEVGCNDLILIKQIQNLADEITGVDPIWIDKDFEYNEKTSIKGAFINELSKDNDFKTPPDLILSAHTFEHIPFMFDHFKMLYDLSSDNCRFIIELPCFDTMVETKRFDQIFHQHLQHISLHSMMTLINRLGCKYVNHKFNFGYWGGTLLFCFDKVASNSSQNNPDLPKMDNAIICNNFEDFKGSLSSARRYCEENENVYGFGAAQMLPVIAHHMDSDLGFLDGIIDDNPERVGTFLPSITTPIVSSKTIKDFSEAIILITALDSTRPILRRLLDLSPKRILNPLNIF